MESWGDASLTALSGARVLTQDEIVSWVPHRTVESHKYINGNLLARVGSKQYPGAAVLSLGAAVQVGAGLVHALVPEELWGVLPVAVPEVIPVVCSCNDEVLMPLKSNADAVLVGCGVGADADKKSEILDLLELSCPTVIDGDGLFILSEIPEINYKQMSAGNWLLTPHRGELRRLIPSLPDSRADMLKCVRDKAEEWGCTILVKGFPGVIVTPKGDVWICEQGDPAATTAGCGDVLAGACAGFLAQGLGPQKAAVLASWAVVQSTRRVLEQTRAHSVRASDLIPHLAVDSVLT